MGRTSYLVTPPSSANLGPLKSGNLPELNLGPAQMQQPQMNEYPRHGANQVVQSNQSSYGYATTRPPATTEAANKAIPRKSKPSRKTTHSQIEKRRREKINDTMQRLKDLVPACHDQDLLLRKLDVLTATADYIEELQTLLYGRPQLPSPASLHKQSSASSTAPEVQGSQRRSSRTNETPKYVETASNSSHEEQDVLSSPEQQRRTSPNEGKMEVEEVSAAESLLHISESPMLRPVIERQRLSISELMCL